MKKITWTLFFFVLGFACSAQAQQSPTREQCNSSVEFLSQNRDNLSTIPFKKLFLMEKEMFTCSKLYKEWSYSLADATISQFQLARCEDFINKHKLDDAFFKEDEEAVAKALAAPAK
jgi:hypothetical protein